MINKLKKIAHALIVWRRCMLSRGQARIVRKTMIRVNGHTVVDKQVKKKIKAYCKATFGTTAYWPWLAVYSEMRGRYIDGWVPNDFFIYKVLPQINRVETSHISVYKTLDYKLFGDMAIKPVFLVIGHKLFDHNYELLSRTQVEAILKTIDFELVIKKDGGSGGHQVRFVQPEEIHVEKLFGKGGYVIQPAIRQHHKMAEVYPHSVNTLRVLTYNDSFTNVTAKAVIMVFGTGRSKASNAAQGGRYLYIGDDGRPVTKAFRIVGPARLKEEVHPDTGFLYNQIEVPFVEEVKDFCIRAHYKFPYTGYIGWDVCIDDKNQIKILEWNARLQVFWDFESMIGPGFDVNELKGRIVSVLV